MESFIDLMQSLIAYMGIYLGGGNTYMAKEFLDNSQISSIIQQVGREGMSQRMGANILIDLGLPGIFL